MNPTSPSPTLSAISSEVEGRLFSEAPDSFVTAPAPSAASPSSSVACFNPEGASPNSQFPLLLPPCLLCLHHAGPMIHTQFSSEMIRELTRIDKTLRAVINALNGSENQRKRLGIYWSDSWKDLHVADGCLFWDDKVVLPELLREPFFKLLHSTHAGARAMKSRCDHVWFPNTY